MPKNGYVISVEHTILGDMQRFRNLLVWQKARVLTKRVYTLTRAFPADEKYGLTSQLRRAAVSIMSNIAEGSKKASPKEYAHALNIAEGSSAEVESLMISSSDQEFIKESVADDVCEAADEISRMLYSLRRKVLKGVNS